MSSEEDFNDIENSTRAIPDVKKRRIQRACDTCRRKKIRCDGRQNPGNRCSNCVAFCSKCTYVEAAKKRGPSKGYVESLENRLERMEKLLQKVCPDAYCSQDSGGANQIDRMSWLKGDAGVSNQSIGGPSTPYSSMDTPLEDLVPSDDEEIGTTRLSENFREMNLNSNPRQGTYFIGKSSGVTLIEKAVILRKEATGSDKNTERYFDERGDDRYPWEAAARDIEDPIYVFPDEDLGVSLVHLYFVEVNPVAPLLHRPSFECKAAQGLHLRDPSFAAVYLLVCACASRYSGDPRVFLDGVESEILEQSAGWKFFQQVQMVWGTLLRPPYLEDLQIYCLSAYYLKGTSTPQACWTVVGIGIRLAQDVGAHRRKSYVGKLSVEGELWKRAFWMLVVLDRQTSSSLGRSCAIQDEDFDLDLPIECDDEYWENPDPEQAFRQPPDKPSAISFFISLIKLANILSFAHRTIYSINRSKSLLGFVGQKWEQRIVAELDSSLNKWIAELPDHLRWDPTRDPSSIFFMQSSLLHTYYYYIQIFIHRPFIPSPRKPSPLSFPSLAICTNAARSCSHVIDIYRQRSNGSVPFLLVQAFNAGTVLLLNIWGGRRSGLLADASKEMADVHKCMAALKSCEPRWHVAGKLWNVLYELASAGDLLVPQSSPQGGTKRERDLDSPVLALRPLASAKESTKTIIRTRAASCGVHIHSQQPHRQRQLSSQPSITQPLPSYDLPISTDDLGRLPLHGQVNFPMTGSIMSSMSPGSEHPSDAWITSLLCEARTPMDPVFVSSSSPALVDERAFVLEDASSMDVSFFNQIHGASEGFSALPTGHPATTSDPDPVNAVNELQALVDAVTAGVPSPMVGTNAMVNVDVDMTSMWPSVPTESGINDLETYLSNVSGSVNLGGPTARSHGQPQWQHRP